VGIPPAIGMFCTGILFIFISNYLFSKTIYATIIYLIFAFSACVTLGQKEYDPLLRQIFSSKEHQRIRLYENAIVLLPFGLYLLFEAQYLAVFALLPIGLATSFMKPRPTPTFVLPTPFKKFPFEFIVGFRKYYWFIAIVLLLMLKAIQVDNYNLALFSFGLLFFTCMGFFVKPEKTYFVWVHSRKTKAFLLEKFKIAFICMAILSTIPYIGLVFLYPDRIFITSLILGLGYLFLSSIILAKYSAFPLDMNVPQALLYAVSLWFPPILLIVMIIFYKQSKRRLDTILE